jgi:hypothetical protein
VAVYDDIIFKVVRDGEADLEQRLEADVMYFSSEIRIRCRIMNVADQIEQVREYPADASEAFRQQLDRARLCREMISGQQPAPAKGIDRSGEFAPLPRPTIIRALIEEK